MELLITLICIRVCTESSLNGQHMYKSPTYSYSLEIFMQLRISSAILSKFCIYMVHPNILKHNRPDTPVELSASDSRIKVQVIYQS